MISGRSGNRTENKKDNGNKKMTVEFH
jgi:hypothetical protein